MRTDYLQIDRGGHGNGGEIGVIAYPDRILVPQHPREAERKLETDLRAIRNWGAKALASLLKVYEFELLQIPGLSDTIRCGRRGPSASTSSC